MVKHGHRVYVQHTAGEGTGFSDEEYIKAGAEVLPTIEEVYSKAEMIVKVKEPIEPEYSLVKPGQLLFTYFHFASDRPLTDAMVRSGAICIAYETVRDRQGALPLLVPMSEVAGRMSVQEGARFLEKPQGGRGLLLGGVPGVKPAKVLVLGAGVVGRNAALMAAGLGADVTITDISLPTLRHCAETMPKNVKTLYSSAHNIESELPDTDLVIGSVLIPGAKTPHLVTKDMVKLMRPGSVMVDVAIDQGGCFETSHPTTHSDPVFTVDGVIQYAVANIPGAVPFTSTLALTNATLPYALRIADMGWKEACRRDAGLAEGVNVVEGKITFKAVAEAFDLEYTPLSL
jgi:alanine dehydrogenase